MIVNIRKDGDQYMAYFIEMRRLIGVNQMGADIINWYFNLGIDKDQISHRIVKSYCIPPENAVCDVTEFLKSINLELQPSRFNDTDQADVHLPIGIELEITSACNLRCIHCLQSNYSALYIDLNKAYSIIDTIASAGVFEISIIGGEPFKHPSIFELLKHANDSGLAVGLTTNGTLIKKRQIHGMAKMKNLSVAVSVDGIGEDHDHTRGNGVFIKIDRTIRRMLDSGIEVEAMFTVTSYNIDRYKPVLEYCNELGITCNFNLFKPFKIGHVALVPNPQQFFELILTLFELRSQNKSQIGLSNSALVGHLLGLPPKNECRAGQAGLVIDVHGHMLTCPSLLYCGYYH